MKVIFLDVDGVLNSHVFYEKRHKKLKNRIKRKWSRFKRLFIKPKTYSLNELIDRPKPPYKDLLRFFKDNVCPDKIQMLVELCNKNDIKVCVSSTWQNYFTFEQWNMAFNHFGFKHNTFVGITGRKRRIRGEEIQSWIDKNNPSKYVIIDDDSDMLKEQFLYFCHTDGWFGLSPNHIYKIRRYFIGEADRVNFTC